MPAPIERFEFMKATVRTQVDTSQGMPLCFIDITTPAGHPDVSIGWSPSGDRFGVYVNGVEAFPFPDDTVVFDTPTTTDPDPTPTSSTDQEIT